MGSGYLPSRSSTAPTLPVGPPTVPPSYQCLDFNGDGRVDIIDLSILLYYYGKPIMRGSLVGCLLALTHRTVVDFTDVSILMYYWTG